MRGFQLGQDGAMVHVGHTGTWGVEEGESGSKMAFSLHTQPKDPRLFEERMDMRRKINAAYHVFKVEEAQLKDGTYGLDKPLPTSAPLQSAGGCFPAALTKTFSARWVDSSVNLVGSSRACRSVRQHVVSRLRKLAVCCWCGCCFSGLG